MTILASKITGTSRYSLLLQGRLDLIVPKPTCTHLLLRAFHPTQPAFFLAMLRLRPILQWLESCISPSLASPAGTLGPDTGMVEPMVRDLQFLLKFPMLKLLLNKSPTLHLRLAMTLALSRFQKVICTYTKDYSWLYTTKKYIRIY